MRRFLVALSAALMLCLPLTACDGREFALRAAQTLDISYTAYDAAMKVAADAHKSGRLDNAGRDRVIDAGQIYIDAWRMGMNALIVYVDAQSEENRGDVLKQLEAIRGRLNELLTPAAALKLDVENIMGWESKTPALE